MGPRYIDFPTQKLFQPLFFSKFRITCNKKKAGPHLFFKGTLNAENNLWDFCFFSEGDFQCRLNGLKEDKKKKSKWRGALLQQWPPPCELMMQGGMRYSGKLKTKKNSLWFLKMLKFTLIRIVSHTQKSRNTLQLHSTSSSTHTKLPNIFFLLRGEKRERKKGASLAAAPPFSRLRLLQNKRRRKITKRLWKGGQRMNTSKRERDWNVGGITYASAIRVCVYGD